MSNVNYVYYDARSVVQREHMRVLEGSIKAIGCPVEVAQWPSGHKVWRVQACGRPMPIIQINTEEFGTLYVEPATTYPLESVLSPWVGVERGPGK